MSDWRKQKLPHVRTNSHSTGPIGGAAALLAFRLAEQ